MKKRRLFIFAIIYALLIFLFFNNLGSKDTDRINDIVNSIIEYVDGEMNEG